MNCEKCGSELVSDASQCKKCSVDQNTFGAVIKEFSKSKVIVGMMGIFFGCLGVHNFILGRSARGIIQLLLSTIGFVFTAGLSTIIVWLWSLIESIVILAGGVKHDKKGNPLT